MSSAIHAGIKGQMALEETTRMLNATLCKLRMIFSCYVKTWLVNDIWRHFWVYNKTKYE